jgi:hypothetical protein
MSGRDERAGEAAGASRRATAGDGAHGLAYEQARLAYSIIQTLLEHTRVTQDLVALMAQVIDEDTQRALTETPHWSAYMDSRRAMERAREEIEQFAAEWTRMAREESPPAPADPPHTPE